jgi:hypothetical protein
LFRLVTSRSFTSAIRPNFGSDPEAKVGSLKKNHAESANLLRERLQRKRRESTNNGAKLKMKITAAKGWNEKGGNWHEKDAKTAQKKRGEKVRKAGEKAKKRRAKKNDDWNSGGDRRENMKKKTARKNDEKAVRERAGEKSGN